MPAKRSPPGPAGPVAFGDRIDRLLPIDGRKRGLVTDTIGLPVAVDVHPADIQDRDGAVPLLTSMRNSWPWPWPWLRHVFADGGYAGDKLVNALMGRGKWSIEIVRRSAKAEGFEVLHKRWVVERALALLSRNRRLAKDFEASIESAKAWLQLACIKLLMRRLARL